MYSFARTKEYQKSARYFRSAGGTNQGLLALDNPKAEQNPPESGGVPAHRRYSDFGDFSICGAAADFRCILSRVPLDLKKKSAVAKATADFLVGCPVGLEPTVSRSTIWRVNRLR